MSFQDLFAEVQTHNRSLQTLAVLGAELRLRQDGTAGDPQVRSLLQEVLQALNPSLLDGLTQEQQATALGAIRIFFRDAADLLDRPARAPGWTYTDPEILEGQGRPSRAIVTRIEALAADRPDFGAVTRRPGTFLDIGTGVAHLAIEAARAWPALRVVALDVWQPALALARANIAASGVEERIELRAQGIEDLAESEAFSLVWLPMPFIPRAIVKAALPRVLQALEPGGWLVVGQYPIPDEPLSQALARLQIVRSGGHPWRTAEINELLRACGYGQVKSVPGPPGVEFVLGRRAPESKNG